MRNLRDTSGVYVVAEERVRQKHLTDIPFVLGTCQKNLSLKIDL